jgi:CheY-like chemotaxis protein
VRIERWLEPVSGLETGFVYANFCKLIPANDNPSNRKNSGKIVLMDTFKSLNPVKARILVVDDHPSTATTLARALSQLSPDIEALSANSGETALELVREHPVDILITDMMMTGINGLELIEKMQTHPAGRPAYTILVTAYDVPGLKITARRLKVNEIIIKPVRPEHVCQIVSKAIENLGEIPAVHAPEAKATPKILVADDLPDNVALLARYLGNEGYICICAADGAEALSKTRAEMPDLVLLDVDMPVKDGFETLQEIRSDPAIAHIPVIILTAARLEPVDMQSALNMGADDYVTKPFDRRELLARIRTRLRVKEAEDVIRRRNKELNLLPEIGKELSARLDIDELIDVVLKRTVEALGAFEGHIILLGPKEHLHKTYRFAAAAGEPAPKLPDLAPLLEHLKEIRHGFVISDTRTDSRWPVAPEDITRAVVVVPMFVRLELLGLLVLAHEQSGYFSQEHMLLLQALASQAAIAIENARLFVSMKQEQQRLEAVLQCAADAILMFDTERNLSLFNIAAHKLFTDHEINLGQSLAPGTGYDALIDLLDKAESTNNPQTCEITWPDNRIFTAVVTPIEGGCVASLHDISYFKTLGR